MLERILLAAGLVLLGWLGYRLFSSLQLKRNQGSSLGLPGYQPGVATILYFTTPTCAPCRTIQKPALATIRERYGRAVDILQIDATSQPELADQWGVLSVPTTFVIDQTGQPRGVNHGVTRADKLQAQLEAIGVEQVVNPSRSQAQLITSRES